MDKIEIILLENIKTNPKKSFDILLCTTIENNFDNDEWIELMDGIYTTTMTGEDIEKLAKHKDVLSIEQDSEIEIL